MADHEDPKDKAPAVTAPKAVPAGNVIAANVAKAPAIAKPAEVKPTESKPTDIKPAEAKPVQAKPVEAASAPVAKAPEPAPAKSAAPVKVPAPVKAAAEPVAKAPEVKAPAVTAKPGPKPKLKTAPVAQAKPAAKPEPVEKVVPAKVAPTPPISKVAKDVKAPVAVVTIPKAATPKAAPKTAPTTKPVFAGLFTNFMLEETNMDMSTNFAGLQDAMTEAQAKAKAAFEKSTSVLGEVTEFTKGNVEACVASGKILAEGVQGIGSELVAEGRTAFETMTGDIKELAAAKSPTDFFKIQGDMVRKNFDSAVAYSSKNSEAMLKLFSDSFAPLSGRMSIAMEKARSVSI